MNKNQLQLIETPSNWRLDDETKEIGREGLRHARSVLRSTRIAADATAETTPQRKAA